MASKTPVEARGNSERPPALKDHRQKEGLCPQTVGGQLKAGLLELADLVREQLLEGGGWGPFRPSYLCLSSQALPSWGSGLGQRGLGSGIWGHCCLGSFSAGETITLAAGHSLLRTSQPLPQPDTRVSEADPHPFWTRAIHHGDAIQGSSRWLVLFITTTQEARLG